MTKRNDTSDTNERNDSDDTYTLQPSDLSDALERNEYLHECHSHKAALADEMVEHLVEAAKIFMAKVHHFQMMAVAQAGVSQTRLDYAARAFNSVRDQLAKFHETIDYCIDLEVDSHIKAVLGAEFDAEQIINRAQELRGEDPRWAATISAVERLLSDLLFDTDKRDVS